MAKQSIALHSRLTADASGMISEFKRADNESRRATASMRASVSKTMRDIQREFSLPKLAKGVMAGFGIGGGMQLVDLGITKLIETFQEGSKHAQDMAESIENMRKSLRDLRQESFGNILSGMDPVERPAAISRELAFTQQLKERAEAERAQAERDLALAGSSGLLRTGPTWDEEKGMIADPFGNRYGSGKTMKEVGEMALNAQTKAATEIETLRKRVGELVRKHAQAVEDASKAITTATEDQFHLYIQELKLGAGRSPAEVRGEISPNYQNEVAQQWAQIIKDREDAGRDEFDRWAKAGAVRVDDMTRRGMGTGADYKSIGETTNNILSQILDATRRAIAELKANPPRFAD